MLLAGRIGGAGRCGGRGRGLSGISASEARITLTGMGGAAARRPSKAAGRAPTRARTFMGLLPEESPQMRKASTTLRVAAFNFDAGRSVLARCDEPGQPFLAVCVVPWASASTRWRPVRPPRVFCIRAKTPMMPAE